ncbi:unnamed protein product [Ilex paraguariensis]|uniref:Coenzyme Q-binding protein COQ10 START domain-containing protein n=1 Tax=Ilex paraguariensis TaxID=185542 RepID=A0ABC8TG19_9AQUA
MQLQIHMHGFLISSEWRTAPLLLYFQPHCSYPLSSSSSSRIRNPNLTLTTAVPLISSSQALPASSKPSLFKFRSSPNSPDLLVATALFDEDEDDASSASINRDVSDIEIEIEKIGNNRRRIRSQIVVQASLQTVWDVLTNYERLADFVPGLAVSQLLEKRHNFARLFQIGQQNLAFGLKFNAKGIIDCFEKDLETLPFGQRRNIEFKMIEGDFQLFEGRWSIEERWGSLTGRQWDDIKCAWAVE